MSQAGKKSDPEARRRAELAKIHIAKKELALDDDTYREMLSNVGGVSSAADLTARGRRDVLEHLASVGFAGKKKAPRPYPGRPRNMDNETSRAKQLGKIEAYLAEAGRPWSYAHVLAKKICGCDRIEFVPPGQLYKIITALKKDAERHGREPRKE